jgi:hypothetical protein
MSNSNVVIRFVYRLAVHLAILICVFSLIGWIVLNYTLNNFRLVLSSSQSALVLGNSHPECAVNDIKYPTIKNLARSAEPLYYTQYKLKWLLKWNPQIKKVFVELSENQLESRMKDWIWSEESLQRHTISLFPYLGLEHHLKAFKQRGAYYFGDLLLALKRLISGVLICNEPEFFDHLNWGGFQVQNGSHLKKVASVKDNSFQEILNPDADNLAGLREISKIGKETGVEIIFIRCPYHKSAQCNFENSYLQFFRDQPSLKFKDFKNFDLGDDCFFDEYHLNGKGADIFTAHFVAENGLEKKKR